MPHRSRNFYYASATAGQTESIAFDQLIPYHGTLLQITVALGEIQANTDPFTVVKDSAQAPIYDVELFADDFSVKELTDIVIPCHYELKRGDRLVITYANAQDIDVGIEVIIEEAH